jgi:putative MATE family efflux protein
MTRSPAVAHVLLEGAILPTLLRLALPNVLAMAAATAVGIAETFYVGRLGLAPLAAMALVFPFVMLMQMFSAGAMGGGVSSAISRAFGAGDQARAQTLAAHAVWIGLGAGLFFAVLLQALGPALYHLLGGRGEVLAQAIVYAQVVFCATPATWACNTLISVLRGTGNMRVPSLAVLAASLLQIVLGASLGLGLGPMPRWGMAGIALGQVIAYYAVALFLFWYLFSGRARLTLVLRGIQPQWPMFYDILKVGALACLSPLQTVLITLILTALVARHGVPALAGYGIGVRLEFLLIPIAFGVGVAAVPMVGMAIGAGQVARARRVAWTSGCVSAVIIGVIGAVVALWPGVWAELFSSDPAVLAQAHQYLHLAGPAFPFFGLGLTLYFAAQGAGKVLAPVLAATLRLVLVAGAGAALTWHGASANALFVLVGLAMVAYGLATAAGVHFTRWDPAKT